MATSTTITRVMRLNSHPQIPIKAGVHPGLETFNYGYQGDKLVVVMVGLPGRGKTYIARRLERYLSFVQGCPTQIFNVGDYRRALFGSGHPHDFFDPQNIETSQKRLEAATAAMTAMKEFLETEGQLSRVAIYDAANVEKSRRAWVVDQLKDLHVKFLFIEVICENEDLLTNNIKRNKIKSPDYKDIVVEHAYADFKKKIEHFDDIYETIDENVENYPHMKIYEEGEKVEVFEVHGDLQSRIVQFLINVRYSGQSVFYLSRHGQSQYNENGQIGGDSDLSPLGQEYSILLGEFTEKYIKKDENGNHRPTRLWTSSLRRTIQTSQHIKHETIPGEWVQMRHKVWRALDELYAGVCDGMTYEDIETRHPVEYKERQTNKLEYRYPRGESYLDVINRLDPIIQEMERVKEPLLIISHQAILRVLCAYFQGLPREAAPSIPIPLHTVVKLTLDTYDCTVETFPLLQDESADVHAPSH
eukprot:c14125_g1_i1.p1 GENE.c14125_g1_i1~~c14125_g1_i1.p1  ORF type:complete len:484 (+),score=174.95 c14125_g1_i1:34-1452(+)